MPAVGFDHGIAARQIVMIDTADVDRHPIAGSDPLDSRAGGLDSTDPHVVATGSDVHGLVGGERSTDEGSRCHRAAAFGCEHAVDPQARSAAIGRCATSCDQLVDRVGHLVDAVTLRRRHGDDRRTVEERAFDVVGHVHVSEFEQIVVDQVDLGECDEPELHTEQFEDPQVFLGLRFPALGRGDDEDARVDAADPGEHVAQELHVAGHVDEAQLGSRRQHGVSESEVDGQAATLLLLEPVRVRARQGEHQRRLAVVHVPRRGDDRHRDVRASARAATITA